MDGHSIRHRQRGDSVAENLRALRYVPDFDFLGKTIVGYEVGVRLVDGGDQNVVTIRGRIDEL